MAAFASNVAAGKVAYYGSLPATNDALVWLLLQNSGLVADDTLRDYVTVQALLAGATNEATFTGYGRIVSTAGATVTIDNTANVVNCDAANPVWNSTSVQSVGAVCLAYDPDSTSGTDLQLVPLYYLTGQPAFPFSSPASGSVTFNVNANGWARAVPS